MKNKLKYLAIIFVAICCFTIACSGDVLGAGDGSDLLENYILAIEKESGSKRDSWVRSMANTMLSIQADYNNYEKLNDVTLGSILDKNNKEGLGSKTPNQMTINDVAPWSINKAQIIGADAPGTAPQDSWKGLLYMVASLEPDVYQDFSKIVNSDEYKNLLKYLDEEEVSEEDSSFKNLTYEYGAVIRVLGVVGGTTIAGEDTAGIIDDLKKDCPDDADSNGKFTLNGVLAPSKTLEGNDLPEEEYSCYVLGNGAEEKDMLANIKTMRDVLEKLRTDIKKKMGELLASGNINQDLADASADTIANEEGMVANAANTAYREYNNYLFGFGGYTANSPEFSMGTLKNRLLGLKGAGELSSVNEFKGIIENDILGFVLRIGRYLIYAALLFYGVKCIWDGANGKAQFKEMLPYLLVALVFFYSGRGLVNVVQSIFDTYEYENFGAEAFGSIIYIVRILAFAGILFAGVKLMFASAEAKADIKAHLIPIIIGCVFVFSSSLVVDIIVTIFDESGFERSQTYIEQNIDVM